MAAETGSGVNDEATGMDRYPWAGPALFTVVAIAVIAFFWWLL
jgi:hypothetical protein